MPNIYTSLTNKNISYVILNHYKYMDKDVVIYAVTYTEPKFLHLLNNYYFVRYANNVFFCSNKFAWTDDLEKIDKVLPNNAYKYSFEFKRKLLVNGNVYRISTRDNIDTVVNTYNLLRENGLNRYVDFSLKKIDMNIVKEPFIIGSMIHSWKTKLYYVVFFYQLYMHNVLLQDMDKYNILFQKNKLTVIDLDAGIYDNKKDFFKECQKYIRRILW